MPTESSGSDNAGCARSRSHSVTELESLDISEVALLEICGRGRAGIRVYTARYLANAARTGRYIATPLAFSC